MGVWKTGQKGGTPFSGVPVFQPRFPETPRKNLFLGGLWVCCGVSLMEMCGIVQVGCERGWREESSEFTILYISPTKCCTFDGDLLALRHSNITLNPPQKKTVWLCWLATANSNAKTK